MGSTCPKLRAANIPKKRRKMSRRSRLFWSFFFQNLWCHIFSIIRRSRSNVGQELRYVSFSDLLAKIYSIYDDDYDIYIFDNKFEKDTFLSSWPTSLQERLMTLEIWHRSFWKKKTNVMWTSFASFWKYLLPLVWDTCRQIIRKWKYVMDK